MVLVRLSDGFWPGIRKDVESHVKKCAVRTLRQLPMGTKGNIYILGDELHGTIARNKQREQTGT